MSIMCIKGLKCFIYTECKIDTFALIVLEHLETHKSSTLLKRYVCYFYEERETEYLKGYGSKGVFAFPRPIL